jgi:hypothetical protein
MLAMLIPEINTTLLLIDFALRNYRRDIGRFIDLQSPIRFVPHADVRLSYYLHDEFGKPVLTQQKIHPADGKEVIINAISTVITIQHAGTKNIISGIFNQRIAICNDNSCLSLILWID